MEAEDGQDDRRGVAAAAAAAGGARAEGRGGEWLERAEAVESRQKVFDVVLLINLRSLGHECHSELYRRALASRGGFLSLLPANKIFSRDSGVVRNLALTSNRGRKQGSPVDRATRGGRLNANEALKGE